MLAQVSDPHVGIEPEAAGRLSAAIAEIRALPQQPDAVLVSGDLAADGRPEEYAWVRDFLAALPMPVHVLPGNHDTRAGLRAAFGLDGAPGDPVSYAVRCGALRLVVCDTTVSGADHGRLDVPWLREQLAAEPDAPTLLAMHHPPILVGIPVMDALAVAGPDRQALAELLRDAPQVRRIACGHVHRTAVGTVGGCPVVTLSSTQMQLRLDLAARDFDVVHQPPDIALHVLVDGEVVSHVQPVTGLAG